MIFPSRASSGLHDQLPPAEELVDDQPVPVVLFAHHDDRQLVADELELAAFQHLMRRDQPDLLAVEVEMLTALQDFDLLPRQFHRAHDMGERERIGLAGDLHQQRADHRQGQRQLQMEARAAAALGRNSHHPADLLDHVLDDIEPHAASRDFGDLVLHREARQKQELQQFVLTERAGSLAAGETALHDRLPQLVDIDAAAVIGHDDMKCACAVMSFEAHDAFRFLAGGATFVRRSDAVIDGVAQQMTERGVELLQNVAIHLRVGADDFEPHLLSQRASDVAHHARKPLDSVGKWPHAARQRLIVEPMREAGGLTFACVELVQPRSQELLTFQDAMPRVGHGGLRPFVERLLRQRIAQMVDRLGAFVVQPLQSQERLAEWPQPARVDERLAGQAEQAVEVVDGDAQDPVGASAFDRSSGGGRLRLRRLRHDRRGGRGHGWFAVVLPGENARQICNKGVDVVLSAPGRLPGLEVRRSRDGHHQIDAFQQQIDAPLVERDAAFLDGDEKVLHGVSQRHAGFDIDDTGRAFERMCGAHAGLDVIGRGRIALQCQQALGQCLRQVFGFRAEQIVHRKLAEIFPGHAMLLFKA